jgi:hypothetical protein
MAEITNLPGGVDVVAEADTVYEVFVDERRVLVISTMLTTFIPPTYYLTLHPFDLLPSDMRLLLPFARENLPRHTWLVTVRNNPKAARFAEFFGFRLTQITDEHAAWKRG